MAFSFSTVANTSHCKSPADSREPMKVLCLCQSVQGASHSPPVLLHKLFIHHLLSHLFPIKTHNSPSLKNQKLRSARCSPSNSSTQTVTPPLIQCLPAARLTQQTLSTFTAPAWETPTLRPINNGGNKGRS